MDGKYQKIAAMLKDKEAKQKVVQDRIKEIKQKMDGDGKDEESCEVKRPGSSKTAAMKMKVAMKVKAAMKGKRGR